MGAWPWSALRFPCGLDKKPLTEHGFKDARRYHYNIRWPRVGLRTGEEQGFMAIDVDPLGMRSRLLSFIPMTRVQQTPRGLHYFLLAEPWGCAVLAPGIELKANGGYVIDYSREALPFDDVPLARIGMSLAELKAIDPVKARTVVGAAQWAGAAQESAHFVPTANFPFPIDNSWDACRIRNSWLTRLSKEPEGNRNPLLFWTACRFAEAHKRGVLKDWRVVVRLLMECCRTNKLLRDDGEARCLATIENAVKRVGADAVGAK
jgi:hypothetical protein